MRPGCCFSCSIALHLKSRPHAPWNLLDPEVILPLICLNQIQLDSTEEVSIKAGAGEGDLALDDDLDQPLTSTATYGGVDVDSIVDLAP